jgi:hypothetical protein
LHFLYIVGKDIIQNISPAQTPNICECVVVMFDFIKLPFSKQKKRSKREKEKKRKR